MGLAVEEIRNELVWTIQTRKRADILRGAESCLSPKHEVIADFEELRRRLLSAKVSHETKTIHIKIPIRFAPCYKPLSELQSMTIEQLRIEGHHEDRYLVGRVACRPINEGATIVTVIEDSNGRAESLVLHYHDPDVPAEDVLLKGDIVAIKHPYYEYDGYEGASTNVTVYHPSDLVILGPRSELIPREMWPKIEGDGETQKLLGNEAMKSRQYTLAVRHYTYGISVETFPTTVADLYRNRAQAFLKLGRNEDALEDAEQAIQHNGEDPKALFRAAKALYALGQYGKSLQMLKRSSSFAEDNATKKLSDAIRKRLQEMSGKYDFEAVKVDRCENMELPESAPYLMNTNIGDSGAAGRGLYATKQIQAGDLILCDAPFVTTKVTATAQDYLIFYHDNMKSTELATLPLFIKAARRIVRNPTAASQILRLYGGDYGSVDNPAHLVDNQVVLDIFHLQDIIQFNCGCIGSSASKSENPTDTGIWPNASFCNHSCAPSGYVSFVGDMILFRAIRDVKNGEELTISYNVLQPDLQVRQSAFEKTWKFRCNCSLCGLEKSMDEASSVVLRILHGQYQTVVEKGDMEIDGMVELLSRSLAAYPSSMFENKPKLLSAWIAGDILFWAMRMRNLEVIFHMAKSVLQNFGWNIQYNDDSQSAPLLDKTYATFPSSRSKSILYSLVLLQAYYQAQGLTVHAMTFERWARQAYTLTTSEPEELKNYVNYLIDGIGDEAHVDDLEIDS